MPVPSGMASRTRHQTECRKPALPEVVYESQPGAASRPLPPGTYRRHEPEKTVLHMFMQ